MKRSFSFNENPFLFILNQIPSLVQGVEKVLAFYYSRDKEIILGHSLVFNNSEYTIEEVSVDPGNDQIRKFRSDRSPFSWLRKEDIPFEIIAKEKVQLNIFNELFNNILLIKIGNTSDNLSDLFFIYFNQQIDSLGSWNPGGNLSADNKTIIGNLVRNTLVTWMGILTEDREIFLTLAENTSTLLHEIKSVKNELERVEEKAREGMVQLTRNYLRDFELLNRRKYRLTEAALLKVKEFEGEPAALRFMLEKAVQYAETMNTDPEAASLEIQSYQLARREGKPKRPEEPVTIVSGDLPVRYLKTLLLLDKLESAARDVKSRNMLLTSQNIGSHFPTPVTPPAITDALKKHRTKIIYLFKEYPNRWETIRSEFRPIQNLLNTIGEVKFQSA